GEEGRFQLALARQVRGLIAMSNDVNTSVAAETLRQTAAAAPAAPPARRSLNQLNASGRKAAAKTEVEGWQMPMTPESTAVAVRWLQAKLVLKPVETREQNAKDELSEYCFRQMAEQIFKTKNRVTNPRVTIAKEDGTTDHSFIFLLQDRLKVNLPAPKPGQDHRELLIQTFVDAGLHEQSATQLVDRELDIEPVSSIRNPKELLKLLDLVLWDGTGTPPALSDEDRKILIVTTETVKVRSGFLDRVASYCQSVDQLMAIFRHITPTSFPSHEKFALNDSPESKLHRLVDACREIIGG
ncbi:MAG: hypothetical protein EBS89_07485, partial [Proteobacteria bacterium]|nr:hypothetical protein [Pseudomonadota bacterium]